MIELSQDTIDDFEEDAVNYVNEKYQVEEIEESIHNHVIDNSIYHLFPIVILGSTFLNILIYFIGK